MSNALKKITSRAKQIYAKGGTWKGAIKKAGAEYRSGHKSTPHRSSKRKHRTKKVHSAARPKVHRTSETLSHHISEAKKLILDRIGEKERQKFTARLKTDKRRIGKDIAELKRQYRKLK